MSINVFGRKHDTEAVKEKGNRELLREWKLKLKREERIIDRQLRGIDQEVGKVMKSAREAAKRNDTSTAKMFAKEILRARRAKEKLYTSKAQLHSLSNQMSVMQATIKVSQNVGKSAEVMSLMNDLVKVPAIAKTMQDLAQEMTKAGIMEEMMNDALEAGEEDLSDEAEAEVDKVVMEITGKALADLAPTPQQRIAPKQAEAEETDADADIQRRLAELRSAA